MIHLTVKNTFYFFFEEEKLLFSKISELHFVKFVTGGGHNKWNLLGENAKNGSVSTLLLGIREYTFFYKQLGRLASRLRFVQKVSNCQATTELQNAFFLSNIFVNGPHAMGGGVI